jgi:hypothetical protein
MKILRLTATAGLQLDPSIVCTVSFRVTSDVGVRESGWLDAAKPFKTWVAPAFSVTVSVTADGVLFSAMARVEAGAAGNQMVFNGRLGRTADPLPPGDFTGLIQHVESAPLTLTVALATSTSRIPQPLQPPPQSSASSSDTTLNVMIDDVSQKKQSQNAFRIRPRYRYICQPGDHSGDSWHIAAALVLDPFLKIVATTRTGEEVVESQAWVEVEDYVPARSRELVGCDLVEVRIESEAGAHVLKAPGLETWDDRMWGPYTGDTTFTVTAVAIVHGEYVPGSNLIPQSVTQLLMQGSVTVGEFDLSGVTEVDVDVTAVATRSKSFFDSDYPPFQKLKGGPSMMIRLLCRQWFADTELAKEGTAAKFNNKLNQFCRFYANIGIEPDRILINRTLTGGQIQWNVSFNAGAKTAAKDARGDDPLYGMTWASTSVIMAAVERDGVAEVQERLRREFCRGLSEKARAGVDKMLQPIQQSGGSVLLVNMRYATHNQEHNTTKAIYTAIKNVAALFKVTLVRIGVSDKKSQLPDCGWMDALQEPAIDLYGVGSRGGAPIEVDQRRTAYFWSRVAAMKNVVGVIGGRSGSLDAAAFMGVRTFSWDRPRVSESATEQTEYTRLWIAYPLMSIGHRPKNEDRIELEPLKLWLAGFHVIPEADPPRLPLAAVLPVSRFKTKTTALGVAANLRLLMEPLRFIDAVEGAQAWPRAQFQPPPRLRQYTVHEAEGDSNCFFHVCAGFLQMSMKDVRVALARFLAESVFDATFDVVTNVVLNNPGAIGALTVKDTPLSQELRRRYGLTFQAHPDFPLTFAQFAVYTQFTKDEVELLRKGKQPGRPNISIWGDDETMAYAVAQRFTATVRLYQRAPNDTLQRTTFLNGGNNVVVDMLYADLHFDAIEFHVDPHTFVVVIQ